jgi:hypothetical protein
MLAILDQENAFPGEDDRFLLRNLGSPPPVGSLYIDANPGELTKPIEYVYEQIDEAELVRGRLPHATFEALFRAIAVPVPRSFREIIEKMNENQFLKLGPTDRGICTVPRSRREAVLKFLGFGVGYDA